ncbi:hypothetical protein [Shimia thalassica]|uniref:hypothetical protein n=1 Tax=Shimia thalassica TaxID=1715693 RepID=UPI0026E15130|nr:hypothetical protein [Shimia thalassica]MDO6483538.1 hypothetical protein [Shimia thalassica]
MQAWIYQNTWDVETAIVLANNLNPDATDAKELVKNYTAVRERTERDGARLAEPVDWLWWGEKNGLPFHPDWWEAITPKGPVGYNGKHFALCREEMLSDAFLKHERKLVTKWARKPYWTPREAIDLSINFDPFSTQSWRGDAPEFGDTIREREDRIEMLKRGVEIGQISEKVTPRDYIEWLDGCGYIVSDAWRKAVGFEGARSAKRRKDQVAELSIQIDQLQHELNNTSADLSELGSEKAQSDQVEKLNRQIDLLQRTNQQLIEGAEHPKDKAALKRRNISLQKALLAAVVDGYGYRPTDAKSGVPEQIAEMTKTLEIDVTAQSIRKHLKESSDEHVGQQIWGKFPNKTKKKT